MEWKETTPKFGDLVRTKVTFYHHYGIFVGTDRIIQFGLPDNVYRPVDEITVLATDTDTFLNGGTMEVAVFDGNDERVRTPEEIVGFAESRIGEGGYDILHNNCEHFANDCVFGKRVSTFTEGIRADLRLKLNK